jgi:uncharacterized damage-inducible protein DinB
MRHLNLSFLFIIGFGIMTAFGQEQQGYLLDFQQKWENAAAYTIETAELMPDTLYDFRPTDEQMTFREQLLHIAGNMAWLSSSYLGGQRPDRDLRSADYDKTEILAILREGFELAGKAAAELPAAALEEKVEFFAGPMTKRQIVTLMNDHVTHHRGQLIVYLRLNGIKPPRYRGW